MGNQFSRIYNYITSGESLPLRIPLFRLLCISIAFMCLFLVIPSNMLQVVSPYLNPVVAIYAVIVLCIYRISLGGTHLIKTVYILTLLLLNISWFLNGGSTGSISYFYLATLIFPLVLCRPPFKTVMLLLMLLNYAALIFLEKSFPSLVVPFVSANDRYFDLLTGFSVSVLLSTLTFWVVITSYDRKLDEHEATENELNRYRLNLEAHVEERTMELQKSELRFRSFVENFNDIVFSLSARGVFTYVSPNWKDVFGYELSETIGKPFEPFVHPDDVVNCNAFLKKVLETGEKQSGVEYRVLHKDGTWIWYSANGSRLHDKGNAEFSFLGIGRDISDRREAEESLLRSELHYRSVFDNSLIGVAVTDANFVYIDVNDSLCKMLGYERDEVIGKKSIADITHPEDGPEGLEMMLSLKRNEINHYVLEKRYISKSGESITALIYVRGKFSPVGEYIGATGSIMDISDRKKAELEKLQLEQQFFQSQKLESLGIMAGGFAHDFNNLLQSMLGNMELAATGLAPHSEPQKYLSSAMISGKHAAHLTSLMLTYVGRGFVAKKEMNLNDLLGENAEMLKSVISSAVSLELSLSPKLPAIMANEAQIQQVVMNVITNAAESIENQQGSIKLTTSIQNCDQAFLAASLLGEKPEPGRFVFLEVRDNGCGMSEETIKRLFDPFFTTKFTGRGLGMSAVMGIIKTHDGALFVESEKGKGTTFRALFPVSESAQPAKAQPEHHPDRLPGGEGILQEGKKSPISGVALVVDDEKNVLKICSKMFKLCGMTVITACDGIDAVAKFRKHAAEINVVLLDLTMPNMGGIEAMGEIYGIRGDARVILASGFNEDELNGSITGQPASGFIRKPYSVSELEAEIRRVMSTPLS